MANLSKYHLTLSEEVLRFVIRSRSAERDTLAGILRHLADQPHLSGDYQEQDAEGRPQEVFLRGHFLITLWIDHAAKEVRIVRVERV